MYTGSLRTRWFLSSLLISYHDRCCGIAMSSTSERCVSEVLPSTRLNHTLACQHRLFPKCIGTKSTKQSKIASCYGSASCRGVYRLKQWHVVALATKLRKTAQLGNHKLGLDSGTSRTEDRIIALLGTAPKYHVIFTRPTR